MTAEIQAAHDARSQAEVDISTTALRDRWAQALGITPDALESAVQAVGRRVDRIKDHLTGGSAGTQEDA